MNINESELITLSDNQRAKVRTSSFDLSFNELISMYKDGELIITPEYQRLFRWSEKQMSRFIESLILELPIPPIFVIENKNGVYELIDGLQRISTYLNFIDLLDNKSSFKLIGCDIIKELNGLSYDELPKTIQIRLKRSFVRLEVIKKESDYNLRYHMFKRLNRGGEILSEQEVRNCTIRILDSKFINFIKELSEDENFKKVTSKISSEKIEFLKDQELVLRFFALKNYRNHYYLPFDDFLTEYLELVTLDSIDFNYDNELNIFKKTFDILNKLDGKNVFSTFINQKRSMNNFVIHLFDTLTISIAELLDSIDDSKFDILIPKYFDLKKKNTKIGLEIHSKRTGSKSNVNNKIEIAKNYLEKVLR